MDELAANPLEEMRSRGCKGAFQLGYVNGAGQVTVKTVLFQGAIRDDGVDFLLRNKAGQRGELEVALCYVQGGTTTTQQWRLEGRAVSLPIEAVAHGAPTAQIIASAATAAAGGDESSGGGGRVVLQDRERFVADVGAMKARVADATVAELEKDVSIYRLQPRRAELSVSGAIWDRFEWHMGEGGAWQAAQRLLPY
jgi:hypothetical protein